MTSKQDLVQYANQLISKSLDIIKAKTSKDPMVVKDWDGSTPLHKLAQSGNPKALNHPSVDKIKDKFGRTPLHILAISGNLETLTHPSVSKVRDKRKSTPLHSLAWFGDSEILNHPKVDKVKDQNGKTPRDLYNYGLSKKV